MRVLVVGSGGREHALCWKIAQSPQLTELLAAPGNPGIAELCETVPVAANAVEELVALAKDRKVDLVLVGPEQPLALGLADRLEEAGIACFGPSQAATEIESSKAYAKALMARAGIPTAAFEVFEDAEKARAFARTFDGKVAVKADGLAAGKGVIVCSSVAEADAAIDEILVRQVHGSAGAKVVIEEKLEGEEASVIALVDGERFRTLAPAQDHKRVGEGDTGPNTGGMGAYSPAPVVDDALLRRIEETVLAPAVAQLAKEGRPFRGALYAGLICTAEGPKVIEFNARLGDPETQAILPRLESDLLPALAAAAAGDLSDTELRFSDGAALTVILAAAGYPAGPVRSGDRIEGIEDASREEGVVVFQAGTRKGADGLETAGGRVLGVTATAPTLAEAKRRAYEACENIRFEGAHFRRDIGDRALQRSQP